MEERRLKRKNPRSVSANAAVGSAQKPSGSSGGRHVGYSHNTGAQPGQKSRSRRGVREKSRSHQAAGAKSTQNQVQAAPVIQHSFLTDVSDVQEMERGLLSLLNDFHSGKLQAFAGGAEFFHSEVKPGRLAGGASLQLFEDRVDLVLRWFDLWTDRQRKHLMASLLGRCTSSQLRCCRDLLMETLPVARLDLAAALPRVLSLKVMSFLNPRDLCAAAQVSWHWRFLAEQVSRGGRGQRRGRGPTSAPRPGLSVGGEVRPEGLVPSLQPRTAGVRSLEEPLRRLCVHAGLLPPRRAAARRVPEEPQGLGQQRRPRGRRRRTQPGARLQGPGQTPVPQPYQRRPVLLRLQAPESAPCPHRPSASARPPAAGLQPDSGVRGEARWPRGPRGPRGEAEPASPLSLRQLLLSGLKAAVVAVLYDHRGTQSALLAQVRSAVSGRRAQRLGLLAPGGTQELHLLHDSRLSEATLPTPRHREFWEELSGWVAPPAEGGGIDIFSPLAAAAAPALRFVSESALQGWCRQAEWMEEALEELRGLLEPRLPRLSRQIRGRALGWRRWGRRSRNQRDQSHSALPSPQSRPVEFLADFLRRWSQADGDRDGGGSAAPEAVGAGPEPDPQAGLEWRGLAARELQRSEEVYLQRLGAVLKAYLEPLNAALDSGRTILSSSELHLILTPVTSILELNRTFQADLEARLQHWGAEQCVGDVLMKLCSNLRVYSTYLSNYPTAVDAVDRVATRLLPAFPPVSTRSQDLVSPPPPVQREQTFVPGLPEENRQNSVHAHAQVRPRPPACPLFPRRPPHCRL
ncbi:unnamed protein product [Tetraodon nigroviridis]|uniref:(spotted green pufferfish) hypothetical protein n=1 Tax=Tetraodon nigroviridis TaxID=99883 RepID=Q4SEP6_TETNG|nr:unnamed protein product [Tetraodon nigroviridis]